MNDISTEHGLLVAFLAILALIVFCVLLGVIPDAHVDTAARYWGRAV